MDSDGYVSFVVRLWGGEADATWHGELEHVQSGRRWSIESLAHILEVLQRAVDAARTPPTSHMQDES